MLKMHINNRYLASKFDYSTAILETLFCLGFSLVLLDLRGILLLLLEFRLFISFFMALLAQLWSLFRFPILTSTWGLQRRKMSA